MTSGCSEAPRRPSWTALTPSWKGFLADRIWPASPQKWKALDPSRLLLFSLVFQLKIGQLNEIMLVLSLFPIILFDCFALNFWWKCQQTKAWLVDAGHGLRLVRHPSPKEGPHPPALGAHLDLHNFSPTNVCQFYCFQRTSSCFCCFSLLFSCLWFLPQFLLCLFFHLL